MTVRRHNLSWSKIKHALECPYRLQLIVDKAQASDFGPNYHQELGKTIQFAFEMFFNQGINLRGPEGRTEAVIGRVTDKVLASPWFTSKMITYPSGKSEFHLENDIKTGIIEGRKALIAANLYDKPLKSETKWIARFGGIGLFAYTDFTWEIDNKHVEVWDGKGHQKMNADPRQVLHYALTIAASGRKLTRGGLLYWRYGSEGVVPVDVGPQALKDYVDGPLAQVRPIFHRLKEGTEPGEELEAKPSNENCYYCFMKRRCKYSLFKEEPLPEDAPQDIYLAPDFDGMVNHD